MAFMPLKRMPEIAWGLSNSPQVILLRATSNFCKHRAPYFCVIGRWTCFSGNDSWAPDQCVIAKSRWRCFSTDNRASHLCVIEKIGWRSVGTEARKWRTKHHVPRTKGSPPTRYLSSAFTDRAVPNEVEAFYRNGLPVVIVPLPSRKERCRFTLKPVTNTVGDFLKDIRQEDKGLDRVQIQSLDGTRIASSTSIATLMQEDFHLILNDIVYLVCPPDLGKLTSEEVESLSDVRARVAHLYEALNVDQYQLELEKKLVSKFESLQQELEPLEKKKAEILDKASRRSTALSWFGLALMGGQFGVLARLTWWEYSWDIMEPVTYFITYGTTIAMYAYFVLTRQDYILPEVCDRQTLLTFHKQASKLGLDVNRYNSLRNDLARVNEDLKRLRDPLQLHLPLKEPPAYLRDLEKQEADQESNPSKCS